jgi:hypothetical protein
MAFLDKHTEFCENIPAADVSEWVNLGPLTDTVSEDKYGPGEPILIMVIGENITDDGTNPGSVNVRGRYADGDTAGLDMKVYVGPHAINSHGIVFGLPTNCAPSIRLELENLYTGRWSAWIVHRVL